MKKLPELFANNRTGAYLNVVDVHSGAVWAAEGPLAADAESWTLVLWSLQDRGLVWDRLVGDHGAALRAGAQAVSPELPFQRDIWHELNRCAHVQARLDRVVTKLSARTPAVERQAARVAAGKPARGHHVQADLPLHQTTVRQAQRSADAVRFLTQERDVLGFGTETIGTDAGQGAHLRPPYPCHTFMHGAGRYGLQCLANLDLLPPTGSVVIAAPLKILRGSGSPVRALALVA